MKKNSVLRVYTFEVDSNTIQVCKHFFLAALDIGEVYVLHALQNKFVVIFMGSDGRGKHTPHNRISNEGLDTIRHHIESYPKVSAHYTRKDSNREFLGADLTLHKMY